MTEPRVSILTACYNHAHYLEESIRSSLAQTERAIEVLIVDDGSTDNTWPTAVRLASDDARVVVIHSDVNRGLSSAQNQAATLARGEWLLKVDADDRILPRYVEEILAVADRRPDVNCIFSPAILFGDGSRRVYRYPPFDRELMIDTFMIPGPAAVTRTLWSSLGGLDESMTQGGEDWDFWVRAAYGPGLIPVQLETPLWEYRQHAGPRLSARGIARQAEIQAGMRRHVTAARTRGAA